MASVQIQFTEDQIQSLRWLSSKEGRPIEELVRAGVDRMLGTTTKSARSGR